MSIASLMRSLIGSMVHRIVRPSAVPAAKDRVKNPLPKAIKQNTGTDMPTLEDFLNWNWPMSVYIQYKSMRVYMRKFAKNVDGRLYRKVLTVANIHNTDRSADYDTYSAVHTRTGLFQEFEQHLRRVAIEYGYDGIYVELVHNEFLPDVLIRYGYKRVNIQGPEGLEEKNYWLSLKEDDNRTG